MSLHQLRPDGWQDVPVLLVLVASSVFFWYKHDFYLNWVVFFIGIFSGILLYGIGNYVEKHPVVGFPLVILFLVVMNVAFLEKSLAVGAVAAFSVTITIKVYEVYREN